MPNITKRHLDATLAATKLGGQLEVLKLVYARVAELWSQRPQDGELCSIIANDIVGMMNNLIVDDDA